MRPAPLSPTSPRSQGARRSQTPQPRRAVRRYRTGTQRSGVLEVAVKLTVNLLLAVVAGSTLARMLPHYRTQTAELDTLQRATAQLDRQRTTLWHDFSRNFSPEQASSVMGEQSGRQRPDQVPVVWVDPHR